jgi:hypothetical protein
MPVSLHHRYPDLRAPRSLAGFVADLHAVFLARRSYGPCFRCRLLNVILASRLREADTRRLTSPPTISTPESKATEIVPGYRPIAHVGYAGAVVDAFIIFASQHMSACTALTD